MELTVSLRKAGAFRISSNTKINKATQTDKLPLSMASVKGKQQVRQIVMMNEWP